MEYVLYFLQILWYTLGAIILCGLCVALCEWLFRRLLGGKMGRGMILATSIVGTPVHECGHALMCLLFGHRITAISLWQPRATDGNLGYVRHTYNTRNPYHQIGNLFIGIGPILSGLGVITILLALCFPDTWSSYLETASDMVARGSHPLLILWEGITLWPHILLEDSVALWWRIPVILVMLSISLHVTLSPADIKCSLLALPWYAALVLLFTAVTALMGRDVMAAVTDALATYQAVTVALFSIVLSCSVFLVAIAVVVWLLRLLFASLFRK